jgi:sarcosine oxidase subunit gamma
MREADAERTSSGYNPVGPSRPAQDSILVESPGVRITTPTLKAALHLKSWDPKISSAAEPVLLRNQILPIQVGATLAGTHAVLCVAPGEWLIVSRDGSGSSLRAQLASDLAKGGLVLVDQTPGIVVFELDGTFAPDLLSKGCGLDLHLSRFQVGRCARTRFAQIAATIYCAGETTRFELFVVRSYAEYIKDWLRDAAVEFSE